MPRLRPKYGFTLIELIMTIVVIGLIAIPLAISLTAQVQGTAESSIYTTALNLARFDMEKINNLPYASISSGPSSYPDYPCNVTRTVTYARGNATSTESLKQIIVTITQAGSGRVLVNLVTYIAKNVSYP